MTNTKDKIINKRCFTKRREKKSDGKVLTSTRKCPARCRGSIKQKWWSGRGHVSVNVARQPSASSRATRNARSILNGRCWNRWKSRSWLAAIVSRNLWDSRAGAARSATIFSKLPASCIALSPQFGRSIFTTTRLGKAHLREKRDMYAMHVSRVANMLASRY